MGVTYGVSASVNFGNKGSRSIFYCPSARELSRVFSFWGPFLLSMIERNNKAPCFSFPWYLFQSNHLLSFLFIVIFVTFVLIFIPLLIKLRRFFAKLY